MNFKNERKKYPELGGRDTWKIYEKGREEVQICLNESTRETAQTWARREER